MITALVISAGEPQLEKCMESVFYQTVPFSDVVHIDNVIPESVAFNQGLAKVETEWFMKVDGDFILNKNALFAVKNRITNNEKICSYGFLLMDGFLKSPLYGAGVSRTKAIKSVGYPNFLANDVWNGNKLRRQGWNRIKCPDIIGTHCENPDEFQIFRRFFIAGIKHGKKYNWPILEKLFCETNDYFYYLAMRAIEFGMEKKSYPTSHNLDYDREMFNEYRSYNC